MMLKRYLAVVAIILVVFVCLGLWLKPSLDGMRAMVAEGAAEYAGAHAQPGETAPAMTAEESHDWYIAAAHSARLGEAVFACWGAFKVTVCDFPE